MPPCVLNISIQKNSYVLLLLNVFTEMETLFNLCKTPCVIDVFILFSILLSSLEIIFYNSVIFSSRTFSGKTKSNQLYVLLKDIYFCRKQEFFKNINNLFVQAKRLFCDSFVLSVRYTVPNITKPHCPKNNLNIRVQSEPVMAEWDPTVHCPRNNLHIREQSEPVMAEWDPTVHCSHG